MIQISNTDLIKHLQPALYVNNTSCQAIHTLPATLLQTECVKCQACTPVCVCCNLCDILQCQAQPSVNIPAATIHRKNAFIVTTEIKPKDISRCTKDKHYLTIMKGAEVIYYTSYNPHYNVVTGHSKQHLLTKSICINLYRTCKKQSVDY